MKKKLFCIILSLAMVVTFMPAMAMTAFGATEQTASNAEELQAAFTKGGTVKLTSNFDAKDTLTVPAGKSVTLNLNDKTLKLFGDVGLSVEKNAKLTIIEDKNTVRGMGAISAPFEDSSSYIDNYGTIVVEDGTFNVVFYNIDGSKMTVNGGLFQGPVKDAMLWVDDEASLTINGGTFQDNKLLNYESYYDGGAVYNTGTTIINGGLFKENSADCGGAVYNKGTLTVKNATFEKNYAGGEGGAIYNEEDSTLNLDNVTFIQNEADGWGGAVENYGILTVNNCLFDGNTGSSGGAIGNDGNKLVLNKTTFKNNSADSFNGGAIDIYKYSAARKQLELLITDCTFNGNKAEEQGGAIYCGEGIDLVIAGSTNITGNSAKNEEGRYVTNNVEFGDYSYDVRTNVIKTKNAKDAKVGLYIGTVEKDLAYFDKNADRSVFTSDLTRANFANTKEINDEIALAVQDGVVILKTLETCYKLLGVKANVGAEGTAQDYIVKVQNMLTDPTATVDKVNKLVDEGACKMFGNKLVAIADLLKLVGKGTISAAVVSTVVTAELAKKLGNAAINVIDTTGEVVKTVLETKAKIAAAGATAIAIASIVGGVVKSVEKAVDNAKKQYAYNQAVKAANAFYQKAVQAANFAIAQGTQKAGMALATGSQVAGRLLALLAAGKISTTVASMIANTAYYINAAAMPGYYYFR